MSNVNKFVTEEDIGFVTPEMFGAVGDGVADDTQAFVDMFNGDSVDNVYIPNKTYIISSFSVLNKNGLIVECEGILKHNNFQSQTYTEIIKFINCNSLHLKGFHIDANSRYSRCMIVRHSENVVIEDLKIENVGTKNIGDNHVFALGIWDGSHNCKIIRPHISKVYSNSNSTGIYIYDNETETGELLPLNCLISDGIIEDIYPITDGDGLKILNKNNKNNANLKVTNCTFIDCRKRALKFQARGCHSVGNTMIWNEMGKVPIDMQRGYCTSLNDIVITNYHQDTKEHVDGYFDYLVGMFGAFNRVENIGYFVNSNPMWMVDSSYTQYTGYGALVCLGSFENVVDENGNIVDTRSKEYTSHDNVLDGVYGNGVARNIVSLSFVSEENAPADISVLENVRFYSENNVIKNVKIRLTNRGLFVNQNNFTYRTFVNFQFNELENIKVSLISDASTATVNSPSDYVTAEVTMLYNLIDLAFDKDEAGNANLSGFSEAIKKGFLHLNKLKISGMYRSYENFDYCNELKQVDNSKNYRNVFSVSAVLYGEMNPQDDTASWRTLSLASVSIGDICLNLNGVSAVNGIKKGWICIEEPSEDYPRGKWIDYYGEKSNMSYDDETDTLFIIL